MLKKKRVLVGMSGGIDSSATCLMLQEQGYEVVGVTMRVWDLASQFDHPEDADPRFIQEARNLAQRLGIEHYVSDERTAFREQVVGYFISEYLNGRTPNPCVMCNPLFKFRMLVEWANRLDCDFIATGHYVQREVVDGKQYLLRGTDVTKDQSYFLWRLGQDVLQRTLFPLGDWEKTDVRQYLEQKGFSVKAKSKESMEVCFIEDDYRTFLQQQCPDLDQRIGQGYFVDAEGRKIGMHKGFPFYTIGQRKGLGIALGKPAFVLKINPAKNIVMLGDAEQLKATCMLAENWCLVDEEAFFKSECLTVRIRYRSAPVPCKVRRVKNQLFPERGELLFVTFEEPVSAVTPGQSAVFYEGNRLVGGAFIASQRGLQMYQ